MKGIIRPFAKQTGPLMMKKYTDIVAFGMQTLYARHDRMIIIVHIHGKA